MRSTFITAVLLTALGASAQLNPTVTVRPTAAGPVPAECVDERAVPMPRMTVADIAATEVAAADLSAPRSADLRARLRAAQAALDRGDLATFTEETREARALAAAHPSGAERDAALETLRVYDDAARVWRYQQDDPSGAFFDESSDLYRSASAYPGYAEAVRRQVINVGGRRYYPSTETRRFLGRQASERLAKLGVRTAASAPQPRPRVTRRSESPVEQPSRAVPSVRDRSTSPRSTPAPRRSTPRVAAAAAVTPGVVAPRVVTPRTTAARTTTPRAAASRPVAAAPTPVPATPPPADEAPIATTTTADPLIPTDTAVPTDTIVATATEPPPAAATTTPADERAPERPQPQEPKRTNILVPAVVILVAIGFLVLLFRASD